MAIYRFQARSTTPTEKRFKTGFFAGLAAAVNVWNGVDRGDGSTGTKRASSIANCSAGNIKDGVTIDDVTGTYDPMAAAVFPTEAHTTTDEANYGPTGAEYHGALNMALYTLISGVVAAGDVRSGTARYSGGGNGTCYVPLPGQVLDGVNVDATTGTVVLPATGEVQDGVFFGPASAYEGTYEVHASDLGLTADILKDGETVDDVAGTYDPITGEYTDPGKANVATGNDYLFAGVSQVAEYPTTADFST